MLSGCATRPAPAIVELNVVFTIVLSRQKQAVFTASPIMRLPVCRRFPRARLRLTAWRPNHARRSPPFCFLGSPRAVRTFGLVVALPANGSGSPNKALQSPLRSWECFRLLFVAPTETGQKENANVFEHRNTHRIFRRRPRSSSNQERQHVHASVPGHQSVVEE